MLTVADAVHLRGGDGQRPVDAVALDGLEHRAGRAVEDLDLDESPGGSTRVAARRS
jgi:hypothetical protein